MSALQVDLDLDDRLWPITPGQMYDGHTGPRGIRRLYIDGFRGRVLITPQATGTTVITVEDGDGGTRYTEVSAHPAVVQSLAETALRGAASAAGIRCAS